MSGARRWNLLTKKRTCWGSPVKYRRSTLRFDTMLLLLVYCHQHVVSITARCADAHAYPHDEVIPPLGRESRHRDAGVRQRTGSTAPRAEMPPLLVACREECCPCRFRVACPCGHYLSPAHGTFVPCAGADIMSVPVRFFWLLLAAVGGGHSGLGQPLHVLKASLRFCSSGPTPGWSDQWGKTGGGPGARSRRKSAPLLALALASI